MKALILNSGLGSRMGDLTSKHPKCMTEISGNDAQNQTILSRQLMQLSEAGITEVVMTTGKFDEVLIAYCENLDLPLKITFVKNPLYQETNYIYSIYCAREYLEEDLLLMHGDLVFEDQVLERVISCERSCMVVNTTSPLPQKDFKAVVGEKGIEKVGTAFFEHAVAAQPLYKMNQKDWQHWLAQIVSFCETGNVNCYAEDALNMVTDKCLLEPLDVQDFLCAEVDDVTDLERVKEALKGIENRTVYMCFSTDLLHSGHMALMKKARSLGRLIVGVLSDEAVVSYKRFPLLPFEERKSMFENIVGVNQVVEQTSLSYRENLQKFKPDFLVHGDDWREGIQKVIREEAIQVLETYGGRLIEYPYAGDLKYKELEKRARQELGTPYMRRGRLKKVLQMKGFLTAMEAHSGLTGLIVENATVEESGGYRQFDAMWISSLCDSTAKGKPDIELVDMSSRFRTIDDICEVTTKPIIFDGDTGGLTEHFVYTVRSLERMGVSMVIIEDKKGLKKNSLFGTEVAQTQATIEEFCAKITAGKKAQRTSEFMICARIESLILEAGMEDALARAFAYVRAGADAIMIHSRKKEPDEIFEFVDNFRAVEKEVPLVVVPTSFHEVKEEVFQARGVNIVIYANQLTRTAFPAMQNAAKMILQHHRAKECDEYCMPFQEIIRLIPDDI